MKRSVVLVLFFAAVAVALTAGYKVIQVQALLNATGKAIAPVDKGVTVGSYPVQMKLSPNGRWLVVTNTGFREQLSVIDTKSGQVASTLDFNKSLGRRAKESLYWGLDFVGDDLYVSRGPEQKVSVYSVGEDGSLTLKRDISNPKGADEKLDNFVSGLVCDSTTLYALNNVAGTETQWRGTVSEIDLASGQSRGKISVGGFPLDAVMTKDAGGQTKEVWVSSEQDGVVSYFHPGARVADNLQVGANPTAMLLRGSTLYVSNSGSDTVSLIDTDKHLVAKTILLRPPMLRGLPVCTPLGLDLSPDGSTLYVALADMNAVAVVDVAKGQVKGYIPVGWYPTDVKLSQDGSRLFVSNAKGIDTRIP
ncbi:MAG TPA: hypothetical protein VMI31_04505, partial [Fimbriimonadaceae bacterium]|nr:hypothetical protein [Fimbriimonadaceae bacterium]